VAKLNVPPTRSSYLSIRRSLRFAEEGFDLLEQKRQIIVLELMGRVENARRAQEEVDELMAKAYQALAEAELAAGSAPMAAEATAVTVDREVVIGQRHLMGIDLPQVKYEAEPPGVQFGFGGSAKSDAVLQRFCEALEKIAALAEIENAVFRLAREVRRTQRRVNALERIFIPNYEATMQYITETIEEREREGFVIMKMVKSRREAARSSKPE
jgi:V/A-type H+-transporting ATPase subunit D